MQDKWRRQLAEGGIIVPSSLPIEIDPVYALDKADILRTGLVLEADML